MVVERILLGIEHSALDTRAERKDRAIRTREPALGKAQREDEDVERLEHLSYRGQVLTTIGVHFRDGDEPTRLRCRSKGILHRAIRLDPGVFFGCELTIGATEQLPKLSRGIDVAVSSGEQAVIVLFADLGRQDWVTGFEHVVVESGRPQVPSDVLSKTAPCRRYLGFRVDPQRESCHGVDLGRGHADHRPPPEGLVGKLLVRVRTQELLFKRFSWQ